MKDIKSLLLSRKDYARHAKKPPYAFRIGNKKQNLYYFGSYHCHVASDPIFKKLDAFWQKFLNKTQGQNVIVMIEGGHVNGKLSSSIKGIIEKDGEGGYINYLALKNKFKVTSPEPRYFKTLSQLVGIVPLEHILLYQFVAIVDQWNRLPNRPNLQDYYKKYTHRAKQKFGPNNLDFSFKHVLRLYEKTLNRKFNGSDQKYIHDLTNPNLTHTSINLAARASSDIRDVLIVSNIKKEWDSGKNIFIVYGIGHAIIGEPALKKLLK